MPNEALRRTWRRSLAVNIALFVLIPFLRKLISDKAETAPIEATTFLEPHRMIRKANKISSAARPVRVELDEEPCIVFFVYYDNDQTAEVSWSFVRELPPKSSQK